MEAKKKAHRDRKNGASREAWTKTKAARNAKKVTVSRPRFLDQVKQS